MQNPEQAQARFSKRLTQDDVEKDLIVFPTTAVAGIFESQPCLMYLIIDLVVGSTGQTYTFQVYFGTNHEMGRVVSIWSFNFLKEKGIRANDEVVFIRQPSDNDTAPMKFKIEVRRKIRLFGQDIWGNLVV
ncbi:hypothetical protein DITRI_Ditri08aG0118100 [Diplodiscus trichospermus]